MPEVEWIDHPDGTGRVRRARPLLLIAASLPWLLVAGLLLLPGRGTPGQDRPAVDQDRATLESLDPDPGAPDPGAPAPVSRDPDDGDPDDGATRPSGTPPTTSAPPDGGPGRSPDLEVTERRGRWRVEPGIEEAAALAVVVARAWLTGLEPVLAVDGVAPAEPDGYAEHLVVEAVEQPGTDAAVVTVVGIVLGGDDLEARVRRVAVPVSLRSDGPRIAGRPWELPAPSLEIDEPERRRIDDPDERLAASEALLAAGIGEHALVALHDTPGWPVIAEVQVDGSASTSSVWLRRHLDGFVVSGTTVSAVDEDDADGDGGAHAADDRGRGDDERTHEETSP